MRRAETQVPDLPDGQELPLVSVQRPKSRREPHRRLRRASSNATAASDYPTQKGVHLEGCGSFPAASANRAKRSSGCLARELREELDVAVAVGDEVFTTVHAYPERSVELHFLRCELIGEPGRSWVSRCSGRARADLSRLTFPPADVELIRVLMLELEACSSGI